LNIPTRGTSADVCLVHFAWSIGIPSLYGWVQEVLPLVPIDSLNWIPPLVGGDVDNVAGITKLGEQVAGNLKLE
jgi:hypothetical protein